MQRILKGSHLLHHALSTQNLEALDEKLASMGDTFDNDIISRIARLTKKYNVFLPTVEVCCACASVQSRACAWVQGEGL